MEKSTALGIGLLAVVGVGAYVYLKRKKSTTTTTTTTSSSAVDSSLGLPAITTTSVVDTVTGATKTTKTDLTSGTAITTVTNVIDETKTNNYIMAKKLSEEVAGLQDEIKNLELEYTKWLKDFVLGIAVVGGYFYLKGKKTTTPTNAPTNAPATTKALVDDNYILAKNIAGEIKALVDKLNSLPKNLFGGDDRKNLESQLQQKQNQLKILSYKMTANFGVDKI